MSKKRSRRVRTARYRRLIAPAALNATASGAAGAGPKEGSIRAELVRLRARLVDTRSLVAELRDRLGVSTPPKSAEVGKTSSCSLSLDVSVSANIIEELNRDLGEAIEAI